MAAETQEAASFPKMFGAPPAGDWEAKARALAERIRAAVGVIYRDMQTGAESTVMPDDWEGRATPRTISGATALKLLMGKRDDDGGARGQHTLSGAEALRRLRPENDPFA